MRMKSLFALIGLMALCLVGMARPAAAQSIGWLGYEPWINSVAQYHATDTLGYDEYRHDEVNWSAVFSEIYYWKGQSVDHTIYWHLDMVIDRFEDSSNNYFDLYGNHDPFSWNYGVPLGLPLPGTPYPYTGPVNRQTLEDGYFTYATDPDLVIDYHTGSFGVMNPIEDYPHTYGGDSLNQTGINLGATYITYHYEVVFTFEEPGPDDPGTHHFTCLCYADGEYLNYCRSVVEYP